MTTTPSHSEHGSVEIVETYVVPGRALPAGSKRAFPVRGSRFVVVDANRKVKDWQHRIATVVAQNRRESGRDEMLEGPLALIVDFVFERPKSHFGSGRNAGKVRPGSPKSCTSRPDLTKLVRAVEDALTGVVYRDDSQIVVLQATKRYACRNDGCHARISIGRAG